MKPAPDLENRATSAPCHLQFDAVSDALFAPTKNTVTEARKAEGAQYARNVEIARAAIAAATACASSSA